MGKRLYVGNLAFSVTSEQLHEQFAKSGAVEKAEVVSDRFSGRSKGFGFVEMVTEADAQKAIAELNGQEFGGRPMRVNEAKPKEDNAPRGRGR